MALDDRYERLRRAINSCNGYRVLDDDDTLQKGDETTCGSTLVGLYYDGWRVMTAESFGAFFGRTVRDMNDRANNNEMDTEERLFRRKL